jgi:hypothetical protein
MFCCKFGSRGGHGQPQRSVESSCQVGPVILSVEDEQGRSLAVSGKLSWRGVGPAGVETSASRSRNSSRAVAVDDDAFVIGERPRGDHLLLACHRDPRPPRRRGWVICRPSTKSPPSTPGSPRSARSWAARCPTIPSMLKHSRVLARRHPRGGVPHQVRGGRAAHDSGHKLRTGRRDRVLVALAVQPSACQRT